MNYTQFFTDNSVFTTTKAKLAGLSKSDLKSDKEIVCLGAFPQKIGNTIHTRMESIWTRDSELAALIKKSKRINKENKEAIQELVSKIEGIIRDKLGYNTSDMETEDDGSNTEEG